MTNDVIVSVLYIVVWQRIYPVPSDVCTVQSAEWDCVYSAQCSETVCTVQSETVCTVHSAEWDSVG